MSSKKAATAAEMSTSPAWPLILSCPLNPIYDTPGLAYRYVDDCPAPIRESDRIADIDPSERKKCQCRPECEELVSWYERYAPGHWFPEVRRPHLVKSVAAPVAVTPEPAPALPPEPPRPKLVKPQPKTATGKPKWLIEYEQRLIKLERKEKREQRKRKRELEKLRQQQEEIRHAVSAKTIKQLQDETWATYRKLKKYEYDVGLKIVLTREFIQRAGQLFWKIHGSHPKIP